MKFTRAPYGHEIQVGDYILRKSMLDAGFRSYRVHRVTPKFAFIRYNEHAEGKFPRTYTEYGFREVPCLDKFPTTEFVVGFSKSEAPKES